MKYLALFLLLFAYCSLSAEKGNFGIEVEVSVNGFLSPKLERITIKSLVENLPADKAGIQPGDRIIQIEDCAIPGCPAKKAKKLMNKKPGEQLNLLILTAEGKEQNYQLIAE